MASRRRFKRVEQVYEIAPGPGTLIFVIKSDDVDDDTLQKVRKNLKARLAPLKKDAMVFLVGQKDDIDIYQLVH